MKLGMQVVKQEDDTGCGIAYMAMLAQKSYQDVKTLLCSRKKWKTTRKQFRTHADDLWGHARIDGLAERSLKI